MTYCIILKFFIGGASTASEATQFMPDNRDSRYTVCAYITTQEPVAING